MKGDIWIINQYSGSPEHGMAYRSYYLAKELISRGYHVKIFSSSYTHVLSNPPKVTGQFSTEYIDEIEYVWVKTPKYKYSKSFGRFWNMLAFMVKLFFYNVFKFNKPEKIIVSSMSILSSLNGYVWSKLLNVEFIFEVRDIWPLSLMELGGMTSRHPLVIFLGWFEKLGYKKSQHVVSLLPYAKAHMVDKGMNENKFRYIPNGVYLNEISQNKKISENIESLIPKDKFLVGYVGTHGIANALEYFIDAAVKLKEDNRINFIFVGKGEQKQKLKEIKVNQQLDNVIFIDPIHKSQVQNMLSYIDVCYIGLKKEPIFRFGVSPNKLFDYMYAAKPIIFAIETTGSLVQVANCGVTIESENSDAIVSEILKLYNLSKEERDVLGRNGKKYVIENHSYKHLADQYLKLL